MFGPVCTSLPCILPWAQPGAPPSPPFHWQPPSGGIPFPSSVLCLRSTGDPSLLLGGPSPPGILCTQCRSASPHHGDLSSFRHCCASQSGLQPVPCPDTRPMSPSAPQLVSIRSKPLTVWITKKLENSERDGNTKSPDLPLEKPVCRSGRNRTGRGTTDWSQIGKGVVKAVYCHPAYLTYMQSTSWKMLGWMKHKLESR